MFDKKFPLTTTTHTQNTCFRIFTVLFGECGSSCVYLCVPSIFFSYAIPAVTYIGRPFFKFVQYIGLVYAVYKNAAVRLTRLVFKHSSRSHSWSQGNREDNYPGAANLFSPLRSLAREIFPRKQEFNVAKFGKAPRHAVAASPTPPAFARNKLFNVELLLITLNFAMDNLNHNIRVVVSNLNINHLFKWNVWKNRFDFRRVPCYKKKKNIMK